MVMSLEELQQWEEIANAATPGPLQTDDPYNTRVETVKRSNVFPEMNLSDYVVCHVNSRVWREGQSQETTNAQVAERNANARLFSVASTAILALVREVRELQAENEKLTQKLELGYEPDGTERIPEFYRKCDSHGCTYEGKPEACLFCHTCGGHSEGCKGRKVELRLRREEVNSTKLFMRAFGSTKSIAQLEAEKVNLLDLVEKLAFEVEQMTSEPYAVEATFAALNRAREVLP